jgi:hypothetical protein
LLTYIFAGISITIYITVILVSLKSRKHSTAGAFVLGLLSLGISAIISVILLAIVFGFAGVSPSQTNNKEYKTTTVALVQLTNPAGVKGTFYLGTSNNGGDRQIDYITQKAIQSI